MADRIENLTSQHDVIATSISSIIYNLSKSDQEEDAKRIIRHNIIQAYVYNITQTTTNMANDKAKIDSLKSLIEEQEITKEISKWNLKKKDIDELLVIMYSFQAKAGIKPVQIYNKRDNVFEDIVKKLGE